MQSPDFLAELLGEEPRAAFHSFQDQFGQSQNQRRFYQGQFSNIQNEFQGKLIEQIRQGTTPSLQQTFTRFLGGFPFSDRFASMAPSIRGAQTNRFAPQARFDFFQ
jgi:hypothetical protein